MGFNSGFKGLNGSRLLQTMTSRILFVRRKSKLKTKLIFIFDFGITKPTLCLLILYGYPKEKKFFIT